MVPTRSRNFPLAAAALVAMIVLGPGRAVGEDGGADARLQKLSVELKHHDVADTSHAATAELGKAEALKDKARPLIGERREREVLDRTLDELEATLSLIEAKIIQAAAKAKLDAAKAKREEIRAELAKVRSEADALEKQQAELEKKLGGGK
jgi:DNA repair exonuclease SbcCD ATPase subunit